MKPPHLLLILMVLAAAAGLLLRTQRQSAHTAPLPSAPREVSLASFLEEETGLPFKSPIVPIRLPADEIVARIDASLTHRFGPEGLPHRAGAFALLSLLPPGQDLRQQWVTATSAGAAGWFDPRSGTVFLHENFHENSLADQATLVRLTTRALLHQHDPPPAQPLSDDQAAAREAIHGGIAANLEGRFRAAQGDGAALPTSAETEREAALLSLPLYLHNLVQLPVMQGKDHVEAQLNQGASVPDLLATLPRHTLAILNADATPAPRPTTLPVEDLLLRESLGAYATQLLCERLSDYLVAESLGPAWRADEFTYFQRAGGTHLFWISEWDSAGSAAKAASLLRAEITPPGPGEEPDRYRRLVLDGPTLRFANCADQSTLDELLPAAVASPESSNHLPAP